jgi:hypothetical protein
VSRSRLVDIARIVLGVLVVVAIGVALQRNWGVVSGELARLGGGAVLASFGLALLAPILTLLGWRVLLADLGARLPLPASASVFLVGQLGKYLPGSVWSVAIQADMGGRLGIPRRTLGVTGLLNIGLAVLTGSLVGIPAVPLLLTRAPDGAVSPWWLVLALLLGLVLLWPRLLNGVVGRGLRLLRREPLEHALGAGALVRTVVWFVAAWLAMGSAVWVLAARLAPAGATPAALALVSVSGFCLAAAVGMLSLLVPAGVGVRDGLLVLLLATVLPLAAATAVVVVHRFLSVVVDLVLAGLAFTWGRAHHLVGRADG